MALPPNVTELADDYPLPSNATFKAGIAKFLNYAKGLLGATGNAAEARVALGIGPVISFRNQLVNGAGGVNQRLYVSGAATASANQVTLDRWRVVVSGQNLAFGAAAPDRVMTAPAGGAEQIIEAGAIEGGVYTLSWSGTATATVNGAAITNGGQTASLPANTAVTVRFTGGTFTKTQFEPGTVATPFERRPPQIEMALCQRETQKSYPMATGPGVATSTGAAYASGLFGGSIAANIRFAVPMRVAPAVTLYSNNGVAGQWVAFTAGGVATSYVATATAADSSLTVNMNPAGGEIVMTGQWIVGTGF
jgi:hypothetical protein